MVKHGVDYNLEFMTSLNVLLIQPDTTKNPYGGMGVQADGLINALSSVNFIEHNPQSNSFFRLDENINSSLILEQCINQSVNLPNLKDLGKIDIVHSFDAATSLQGRGIANMLGVPHVMTLQLSMHWLITKLYKQKNEIATGLEISCMNSADAVIHVSKEYLYKYGVFNPNSFYMPNGIDLEKWQSTPKEKVELPGRKDAKKLCYIGRYAEMKNIEGIVNADIPDNVDVYFIGSDRGGQDPYFNLMTEYVKSKNNAYYLGPKHGDDKVNTLRTMDAVIVPSHHEPFGIVCLEALASECVLISSFESGMGEYLTEDIAIKSGTSSKTISEAIQKWLNLSKEEIQERIVLGKELCKKYSWKNSVEILENIYKHILKINKNG